MKHQKQHTRQRRRRKHGVHGGGQGWMGVLGVLGAQDEGWEIGLWAGLDRDTRGEVLGETVRVWATTGLIGETSYDLTGVLIGTTGGDDMGDKTWGEAGVSGTGSCLRGQTK